MPKLFYLVAAYAQHIITMPPRPPSPPMSLARLSSSASLQTKNVKRIETVAVVLMNITHIVCQMVPDSKCFLYSYELNLESGYCMTHGH
jgi:hypothetical protein